MAADAHYVAPGKNYTREPDLLVQLISEDLKGRYFFDMLEELGLEACYFRSGLGSIVLTRMGFDPEVDEHLNMYDDLLEHYSTDLGRDYWLLRHNAEKVYFELVSQRKKL